MKTNIVIDKPLMTVVHFNRIAMQRGWDEVWTVHNSRGCFNVRTVHMNTPMYSVFDKAGRQPRAKFKGPARVTVANGVAVLNP